MKNLKKILVSGLLLLSLCLTVACGGKDKISNNTVADQYKITVACQTEMGEEEVLNVLKTAYEAKNPDVKIEIKTFSGEGFEEYMGRIAADQSSSPNIIWTADTYHSYWNEYFVDLRPYYEASAETDYSLYYETMLDAASKNGVFKPTKNYTNPLGAFDREKDAKSDGKEHYSEHSDYGLFYAPRDYNKPAVLCNTKLFSALDETYESVYKTVANVSEMPADYKSATARLQEIVNGIDWDDFYDLPAFARFIAEKVAYIINNASGSAGNVGREWAQKAVLNMFLEWEPTYTTVMNALGVDLINDDGTLNLSSNATALQQLHDAISPSSNDDEKQLAGIITSRDIAFASGNLFMTVCSRPVVLGYGNTFKGMFGETSLEAIPFPVENIAAGNSGYAISSIWEDKGMTVDGVYKSYTELSWDFIKFIITEEGQEVAGATGLNIPVLTSLYEEGEWRNVESLGNMNHDAWVAGNELKQDTYNIFKADKRNQFRNIVNTFFGNLLKSNYNNGSLEKLIDATVKSYNLNAPTKELLNP